VCVDNPEILFCCICCLVLEVGLRLFELLLPGIFFMDIKDMFSKWSMF
jgi:hypothetical protein